MNSSESSVCSLACSLTFHPKLFDSLSRCFIVKIVGFIINDQKYFLRPEMNVELVNASIKRKLLHRFN